MEFWGLEVKPGQTIKCEPEDDHFLHLSQGALGESKKDDKATMYVKVGDKKLSIGTLSTDRFPQIQFDLVFEKEFELSHTSKTASVFFSGYKVFQPAEGDEMDFDSEGSEDEEEEMIIPVTEAKEQKRQVKIDAAASKPKAVAKDVGKNKKDDDESDSDDSDSDDSDEGLTPIDSDDADLSEDDTSEDEDASEDDEEEEETPKKPETGKKRAAESALKTPASDKKAKVATPSGQKTGDKKGHLATPYPAKKGSKTPATNEKSPKSGGSVACKSCSKTFNSEMALQSHSKAKHESK